MLASAAFNGCQASAVLKKETGFSSQTTKVTFKTNETILFQTGFQGSDGTRVIAFIAPCGTAENDD